MPNSLANQKSCYLYFWKIVTNKSNSLLNDKILDWTEFKAFADIKLNVAKITISVFDKVENIVGKGENASCQHFLLFPQCFQKASFSRSLKVRIVWLKS